MSASRSTTSPPSPANDPPPSDEIVILQLGTQRFTARTTTLTSKSHFFTALLSGKWGDKQPDGSYFIDSDPDVFGHILRYLRSGVFPLFYRRSTGFEYGLYALILEQARFFGVEGLAEWIDGRKYLQAVKVERWARVVDRVEDIDELRGDAETGVEYFPDWKTERVYVCPRGIYSHRGEPWRCGRQCRNAQGDEGSEYVDEQVLKVVEVRKKVVFDMGVLFGEGV